MNLKQINDLHERAMSLAEAAIVARTEGDEATSRERFQEALELARQAAARIAPHVGEEPMRSVLHRSAASLALNCEEYRLAEKLLAVGLATMIGIQTGHSTWLSGAATLGLMAIGGTVDFRTERRSPAY